MILWTIIIMIYFISLGWSEEKKFVYDDHGKRDPFWPLVGPTGFIINYGADLQLSDIVLEGIMTDQNGNNIAIINAMIVKPNDKIGAYIVQRIEKDRVVLIKGKEQSILKLKKED